MSSTFETLPDEILMIIFQYSGDVHTILRTFLGINQRINRILIDKRLHLLIDYLSIYSRHVSINDYYNSIVFYEVSHHLSSINGTVTEQQLSQYFRSIISFHIQEQYKQLGSELQSKLMMFQAQRQQLTDDEIIDVDNQLNQVFNNLRQYPININDLRQIQFLVHKRGARLECDDSKNSSFNFAMAINRLLHHDLNNMKCNNKQLFHLLTQLFKTLIISNPHLLKNEDYYIYTGYTTWLFLLYSVYKTQCYRYNSSVFSVNMDCYQAVISLLFFALQYQRLQPNIEDWIQKILFNILNMIRVSDSVKEQDIFIEIAQWEILNIVIDIYSATGTTSWQDDVNDSFQSILGDLINKNRLDVINVIYHRLDHVRYFFNQSSNCRTMVDKMTRSKIGRQLLKTFMDEKPLETWITKKDLVFVLLQKKERKLLERLLKLYPFLIHQLDENGNDPLLHICLKVRGCRHRIVEFLITMKPDFQRKNFNNENFFNVIHLKRNQQLLEKLNIQDIIEINHEQIFNN